jgi:hypothetical protein
MSCRGDMVEIENVEVTKETDKALLCKVEGVSVWIPKSQLCEDSEVKAEGDSGTLMVPAWVAEQKDIRG